MKSLLRITVLLVVGIAIGSAAMWFISTHYLSHTASTEQNKKPLYWVAPMNPNYRRDQPGKSPMGMDLIPVYQEQDASQPKEKGVVTISPDVINNLGVRTAQVKKGSLNLQIETVGYVQYDEDHMIHVHPRVEGWVEKLYAKAEGDKVKQGEPLYALYSPTLVNAQEEFLLALKRKNPALIAAAEARLSALEVPTYSIKQIRSSQKVSQTVTIRAPQSGVVDNLVIREGMYVKPVEEMMSISQLEHIWVIGDVFERQAMTVKKGDPVTVMLDYLPGRKWQGAINYVYPSLKPQLRTAQVRVHIDNPDGTLHPGMFAHMQILPPAGNKTLLIPRQALIRTGQQSRVVLAQGEGRFKSIAVTTGRMSDDQVEILAGLIEGDRIVTSAQFLIDSESSKTSDFQRMDHHPKKTQTESPTSVWVDATVKSVMPDHHMLTLSHEPVEAWNWPAMTMDFTVAQDIDLKALQTDMKIQVKIRRDADGKTRIEQIQTPESESDSDAHSMMMHDQHSSMNHSHHHSGEAP